MTGFCADLAGLGVSALVSDQVTATAGGVVTAALILEPLPIAIDVVFYRSVRRMRAATTEAERGQHAFAVLFAVVLGGVWVAGGVAIADWLTPAFNVHGFWPYIGTVAAVSAANGLVYLPLHLARRARRIA